MGKGDVALRQFMRNKKRFQTDLQQIFGMLKYRGDKEKQIVRKSRRNDG